MTNNKNEFLKKKIEADGRNYADLALAIKAPTGSFKGWVRDGKFPADKLELLAIQLKTTVTELKEAGVQVARHRREAGVPENTPLLGLIKSIANSKINNLDFASFKRLMQFQQQLKKDMSPEMVKEILERI